MNLPLFSLTNMVKGCLSSQSLPPGWLFDMTLGSGQDTLFLLQQFPNRPLLGIDIQNIALQNTQKNLAKLDIPSKEDLIHLRLGCHSQLQTWINELHIQQIALVMYNLGYLPGSDKKVITKPTTTLESLRVASPHLAVGGMISLMIYQGHSGGEEEAEAIFHFIKQLTHDQWRVWKMERMDIVGSQPARLAPSWILLQKLRVGNFL